MPQLEKMDMTYSSIFQVKRSISHLAAWLEFKFCGFVESCFA